MAAETLAELQAELVDVKVAIAAARNVQSYSIAGRTVARQQLASLLAEKNELIAKITKLERRGIRVRGVTTL